MEEKEKSWEKRKREFLKFLKDKLTEEDFKLVENLLNDTRWYVV